MGSNFHFATISTLALLFTELPFQAPPVMDYLEKLEIIKEMPWSRNIPYFLDFKTPSIMRCALDSVIGFQENKTLSILRRILDFYTAVSVGADHSGRAV